MRWVTAAAITLALTMAIVTFVVPSLNQGVAIWVGGFWEWLGTLVPVHMHLFGS